VLDEHIGRLPGPVLNFDVLDRQFGPAWCREFDQSECRKCKRTIKHKTSYGITVRLCLDTECFNPKIKAAKAAVMPAAAAWGSDDSLDSLSPHRYRILPNNLFDAQVCKGCPDCVTGKLNGSKRTICKRPRCHDHLREQARAVLQQRYKTYSEHIHIKLLEQMDAAGNSLASVPPLVLRALLLATAYPLDIDDNFLSILRNIDSKTAATHVISLIAENYIKEMGSDELNILRDAMPELFEGLAVDTEPPLIPRLAISKEDE